MTVNLDPAASIAKFSGDMAAGVRKVAEIATERWVQICHAFGTAGCIDTGLPSLDFRADHMRAPARSAAHRSQEWHLHVRNTMLMRRPVTADAHRIPATPMCDAQTNLRSSAIEV